MVSFVCLDDNTEDAQGMEGQVSAKQSPIYLPVYTKFKWCKLKGATKYSSISSKIVTKKSGSKQVYTKTLPGTDAGPNNCTFLPKAVIRILLSEIDKDTRDSVWHALTSVMPKEGDTSIENISDALFGPGMQLNQVSG